MKSCNTFLAATILTAVLSHLARAQEYHFTEIPSGISIFASPSIFSITDKGEFLIVLPDAGPGSAFIYNGHTLTAVPANAGDTFLGLNTPGYLVGTGNAGSFLQDNKGKRTPLTAPSGESIAPYNLNNLNVIVGQGYSTQTQLYFGFSWREGTVTPYYDPKAASTNFNGNNDIGDYVGNYSLTNGGTSFGFLLTKSGKASLINVPTLTNIYPAMLNNVGLVIGTGTFDSINNIQLGWYMTKAGKLTTFDLADSAPVALPGPKGPLTPQSYNKSTNVYALNNLGWIGASIAVEYIDGVGGYFVSIPFVGKPGG